MHKSRKVDLKIFLLQTLEEKYKNLVDLALAQFQERSMEFMNYQMVEL